MKVHRGVVSALGLVVFGCGGGDGTGDPRHHARAVVAHRPTLIGIVAQRSSPSTVARARPAVVDTMECAVSGKIEEHDDDRLVFVDCSNAPGEILSGTLQLLATGGSYTDMVSVRDGETSTLRGGWSRTSETSWQLDQSGSYPGFDGGPPTMMQCTGQATETGGRLTGAYTCVTGNDTAAGRPGTMCQIDVAGTFEQLLALSNTGEGIRCDDPYTLDGDCVEAAEHLCDRMPSQNCDTARMAKAVNGVTSACGSSFHVPAAASYCLAATGYNIEECVRAGI